MLVNTIEFSPIPKYGMTRADKRSLEYLDWYKEEHRRCKEGYTVGGVTITGTHYWYLNYWKIRGVDHETGRKSLIYPKFVDMDYEFFNEWDRAIREGKNFLALKARQKGFSEKAAAIVGREFSIFPHSQSIITAGEDKYSLHTTRMCIKGLNALKDTEFFKRRTPDTHDLMIARYKEISDGNVVWKGYQSEIHNITSKNNVQSLIGKSPSLVYFEEAGRFKGIKDVYSYIQPAMEAEGMKTGIILLAGTGGEMEQGAEELAEMFYNPDKFDLLSYDNTWEEEYDADMKKVCYFVPAYKFMIIDDDGNSDIAASRKILDEKRELARKGSPEKYYNTLTQMPYCPSEALLITGGNIFNQALLNARLAEIRKSKEMSNICQRGTLNWTHDKNGRRNGVDWKSDPDGEFLIIEHPDVDPHGNIYKNLYIGATDSYDFDATGSKYGSKGSCQIFKKFKNADSTYRMFAARITQRPRTAKEFYENTAKLMVYYGGCKNLIEYSNLRIFDWYEANSFSHLLKERPRIAYASTKKTTAQNQYGIHASTKNEWISALRDYIEDFSDNLYDQEQIEAFIKYRDDPEYNCDITISSALCIIHDLDNASIKAKEQTKPKYDFFSYKSDGGQIVTSNGFT